MRHRISDSAVYVDSDGEIVLLDMDEGKYFTLRGAISHVFQLLERGATEDELVEAVAAKFKIDQEKAAADVSSILKDMSAKGLVASEAE